MAKVRTGRDFWKHMKEVFKQNLWTDSKRISVIGLPATKVGKFDYTTSVISILVLEVPFKRKESSEKNLSWHRFQLYEDLLCFWPKYSLVPGILHTVCG